MNEICEYINFCMLYIFYNLPSERKLKKQNVSQKIEYQVDSVNEFFVKIPIVMLELCLCVMLSGIYPPRSPKWPPKFVSASVTCPKPDPSSSGRDIHLKYIYWAHLSWKLKYLDNEFISDLGKYRYSNRKNSSFHGLI